MKIEHFLCVLCENLCVSLRLNKFLTAKKRKEFSIFTIDSHNLLS